MIKFSDPKPSFRNFFLSAGQEEYQVKKYRYAARMRLLFIIPVLFGYTFISMLSALKETSNHDGVNRLIYLWVFIAFLYIFINVASLFANRRGLMISFSYLSIACELMTNEIVIYISGLVISHAFIFIVLSIAVYRVFFDYRHSLISVLTSLILHLTAIVTYVSGILPLPPELKLMLWPDYAPEAVGMLTSAVVMGILLTFFVINLGMNQVYLLRQAVVENWKKDLSCLERFSKAVMDCASQSAVADETIRTIQYATGFQKAALILKNREGALTVGASCGFAKGDGINDIVRYVTDNLADMSVRNSLKPIKNTDLCALSFGKSEGEAGLLAIGPIQDKMTVHQRKMLETILENSASALSSLETITKERLKANTDGLTGLFNKRYFLERCESEFKNAVEGHKPISLAIFDIDHFKNYNDTFGHVEGDVLLKLVAQTIQSSVRPTDLVARFGGEEFVVILLNTTSEAGTTVAERVRAAVEALKDEVVLRPVTVSGGVASFPKDANDPKLVLEEADKKLYQAKQNGRNRIIGA